jgi:hypothetical protein
MHIGVWPAVTSTHLRSVSLQSSSISAAAAEETTLNTIVDANWKEAKAAAAKQREESAAERMVSPRACQCPKQLQLSLLPNRINLALAGTKLFEAAGSSRLRLSPVLRPLHLTQKDEPSGRLPQRAVNVSPLVLKCPWWNPSYPVPTRLTQHPPPTGSASTLGDRRSPREPSH